MTDKMDFNGYQNLTGLTDTGPDENILSPAWVYYALGMGEEAGEVLGKIKKLFRDKKGVIDQEFKDMVTKECGDVLWYMARILHTFDIPMEDVARANIRKLISRMERGTIHGSGDDR